MTGREDSTCPSAWGFCPEAWGFDPQALECRLLKNHERAAGIPWYRRLWHDLRGDDLCPHEGILPCGRFNDITDATL